MSLQMTAVNTTGTPLSWSALTLPPGLSISTSGLITGTPTTPGRYISTITARSAAGPSGTLQLPWVISARLTLLNPGPQTSRVGVPV